MTEKERIQDTANWPLHPRLPMKRRVKVGMPTLGFIVSSDVDTDGLITLYLGSLFDSNCVAHEAQEFKDLDTLLAAGWVGD